MLDNLSAHKKVTPLMQKHFEVLWMPAYSCKFNAIESVWGIAKRSFRRTLLECRGVMNQDEFLNAVREACYEVNPFNLLKSNHKYLASFETRGETKKESPEQP